jgi:hypothetical protein
MYTSSLKVDGTESSEYYSENYLKLFHLPVRVKELIIRINTKNMEIDSFMKQLHPTTYY